MNEEEIRNLISQADVAYDSCQETIEPFTQWKDSFIGKKEYPIVNLIYNIVIEKKQSPNTLIYRISSIEEELFEKISSNNTLFQ